MFEAKSRDRWVGRLDPGLSIPATLAACAAGRPAGHLIIGNRHYLVARTYMKAVGGVADVGRTRMSIGWSQVVKKKFTFRLPGLCCRRQ